MATIGVIVFMVGCVVWLVSAIAALITKKSSIIWMMWFGWGLIMAGTLLINISSIFY